MGIYLIINAQQFADTLLSTILDVWLTFKLHHGHINGFKHTLKWSQFPFALVAYSELKINEYHRHHPKFWQPSKLMAMVNLNNPRIDYITCICIIQPKGKCVPKNIYYHIFNTKLYIVTILYLWWPALYVIDLAFASNHHEILICGH